MSASNKMKMIRLKKYTFPADNIFHFDILRSFCDPHWANYWVVIHVLGTTSVGHLYFNTFHGLSPMEEEEYPRLKVHGLLHYINKGIIWDCGIVASVVSDMSERTDVAT